MWFLINDECFIKIIEILCLIYGNLKIHFLNKNLRIIKLELIVLTNMNMKRNGLIFKIKEHMTFMFCNFNLIFQKV